MTVGIAMIVRDEEAVLARCLDAVRDLVDELVIVDTGSVDATREIACRYTERVLDFVWCDDFAAARKYAFDQAESNWVCWLERVMNFAAGSLATVPTVRMR
jgi:glycosyltransferase involved in cell wall biosynthesis